MDSQEERLKTDDALDEIKKSLHAKNIVDVDEELVKIVVFRCGGALYAFYGRDVREIISGGVVHPVPSLPEYLPGLINVRGDFESAVDIGYFLGNGRSEEHSGLILMAARETFCAGVIIDAVEDVADFPASSIKPPLTTLSGAAKDLALAEVEWKGRAAVLLDLEKLEAKITL